MAKTHHRVFALIAALLFLATAVAGSVAVIWQIKKDNEVNKAAEEISKIQQQQSKEETKLEGTKLEGFTPVAKVDSLQINDITVGNGSEAKADSTVTAHYTGALAKDGTIFQSSHDGGQPFTSPLSGLIQGWQLGIPGMKAGGKRRLVIPASLAYGAQEQPGIPANSDLVFDIELIDVK